MLRSLLMIFMVFFLFASDAEAKSKSKKSKKKKHHSEKTVAPPPPPPIIIYQPQPIIQNPEPIIEKPQPPSDEEFEVLIRQQNKENIISFQKEDMIKFIDSFPYNNYEKITVPNLGRFYVDPMQDRIKGALRSGNVWESLIVSLINTYALPGTTALHIGGHIGTHALTMARSVGSNGRVYVFEPQPKIFRELFMSMSLNFITNIAYVWAAVGDSVGRVELSKLVSLNEGGTLLIAHPTLYNDVWSYQAVKGTGEYVDLIALDSLNIDNISCIKMDVEGMESAVLDGARNTIFRNRPVIIMEICRGWDYKTSPPEVLDFINFTIKKIEGMGYSVSNIIGWNYLAIPK